MKTLFSAPRAPDGREPGGHPRVPAALEGALRVRAAPGPGQDGPQRSTVPASSRTGNHQYLNILFITRHLNTKSDQYSSFCVRVLNQQSEVVLCYCKMWLQLIITSR